MWRRRHIDPANVRARVDGRCFICELVEGNPDFAHHVFYEDERAVWHIAPLPPGIPFEKQQLAALAWETEGVLDVPEAELATLADRLRAALGGSRALTGD